MFVSEHNVISCVVLYMINRGCYNHWLWKFPTDEPVIMAWFCSTPLQLCSCGTSSSHSGLSPLVGAIQLCSSMLFWLSAHQYLTKQVRLLQLWHFVETGNVKVCRLNYCNFVPEERKNGNYPFWDISQYWCFYGYCAKWWFDICKVTRTVSSC